MGYVFQLVCHFHRRHVAGIEENILGVEAGVGHGVCQVGGLYLRFGVCSANEARGHGALNLKVHEVVGLGLVFT